MTYKIKAIKHNGRKGVIGTPRTDGRYPLRIGRICEFDIRNVFIGYSTSFKYLFDADGNPYFGTYHTSVVENVEETDNTVIITTLNSIMEFEEVVL